MPPWSIFEELLEVPQAQDRNAAVDAACAKLVKRSEEVMNEVVGQLAEPFIRSFHRLQSSPGGNFLCDRMRAAGEAQVAFHFPNCHLAQLFPREVPPVEAIRVRSPHERVEHRPRRAA